VSPSIKLKLFAVFVHDVHLLGEVLKTGGFPQLSIKAGEPSSKTEEGFHDPQLSVLY
jgi:hypothetical protein